MSKLKIDLKQKQNLSLSANVIRSITILNMNRSEIQVMVEQESGKNPLLEYEVNDDFLRSENIFKMCKDRNNSYEYYNSESNEDYNLENIIKYEEDITDNLHVQINLMDIESECKKICHFLIDSLDSDGYLREDEDLIKKKLGIDSNTFEKCVSKIQLLEPSGIGARSLEECLILQIEDDEEKSDLIKDILSTGLNMVADMNVTGLIKKYNSNRKDIEFVLRRIKSLNPKPVSIRKDTTTYVIPDVYMEFENDEINVKSVSEKEYTLRINPYYIDLIEKTDDEEVKKYLVQKLSDARRIIEDINGREDTVLRIAEAVVSIQKRHFLYGEPLKAMRLEDISEVLGIHLSTVSRGINGKYILTPEGLFEIKSFFSKRYIGANGEEYSSDEVKSKIKFIINNEDRENPMSDRKIEEILKTYGFCVSRRTVAKYRENMKILSSSKRKLKNK